MTLNNKRTRNWYVNLKFAQFEKVASVTFFVADSHKIAQPKNILDLAHEFTNWSYYGSKMANEKASPMLNQVAPDGDDFDQPTGTINFYSVENSNNGAKNRPEDLKPLIEAWIEEKKTEGYEFDYSGQVEISGAWGSEVQRVKVLKNPSQEYPTIPESNMANDNAYSILRTLGLPQEPSGSVSAIELKTRIEQVSQEEMQKETKPSGWISPQEQPDEAMDDDAVSFGQLGGDQTRDPWEEPNHPPVQQDKPEGQIGMFEAGRDENYIDSKLQDIYRVVDFAIEHGFQEISWG